MQAEGAGAGTMPTLVGSGGSLSGWTLDTSPFFVIAINLNYSQIPYCQFILHAKLYCNIQNSTHGAFLVTGESILSGEKLESPCMFPAGVR